MPDIWSGSSSTSILHVCKQRRLWGDCADVFTGRLCDTCKYHNLMSWLIYTFFCIVYVSKSKEIVQMVLTFISSISATNHHFCCFWIQYSSAENNVAMTKAKVKVKSHKYSFSIEAQGLENMYTKYEHSISCSLWVMNSTARVDAKAVARVKSRVNIDERTDVRTNEQTDGNLEPISTMLQQTQWKPNEPLHNKTNKMTCALSEDSDQHGHSPSLSLRSPHEKALGPWPPIECTAKTLIRLGRCPGWSQSSLSARHFVGFVVWWPKCNSVRHGLALLCTK